MRTPALRVEAGHCTLRPLLLGPPPDRPPLPCCRCHAEVDFGKDGEQQVWFKEDVKASRRQGLWLLLLVVVVAAVAACWWHAARPQTTPTPAHGRKRTPAPAESQPHRHAIRGGGIPSSDVPLRKDQQLR